MSQSIASLVLPSEPQEGWRVAPVRPAWAKAFKGSAKNIPESDQYWLWYQHRWIRDRSLKRLYPKSRRIGISYSTAYDYVRSRALEDCRTDAWVSSRDDVSALEFIRYCKTFATALDIGAGDLEEKVLADNGSAHVLPFANGKRIYALSGNPDAMASKGGDVGLDEFGLRKNPLEAFKIAYPTITWGGRIAIISSMRPNYMDTLCREVEEGGNPKNWSYHKTTLQDALDQGFLWKLQSQLPEEDERLGMDEADYFNQMRADSPDEESFLQEFMCIPADESAAFITHEMIGACQYPQGEPWEWTLEEARAAAARGAQLFGGLDIGRRKDFTWFDLTEKVGGVYFVRKTIRLRNTSFSDQEAQLYPWLALCTRACGDSTGLGMQLMERAQQRFGKYKIEPVTFTGPVKEELAYPLRMAHEDRSVRYPFDKQRTQHLRAVKKETTASGNIRFSADTSEEGHADGFWALALCLHAGGRKGPIAMPRTLHGGGPSSRRSATQSRTL